MEMGAFLCGFYDFERVNIKRRTNERRGRVEKEKIKRKIPVKSRKNEVIHTWARLPHRSMKSIVSSAYPGTLSMALLTSFARCEPPVELIVPVSSRLI